jgi:hypothetical protein
MDDAAIVSRSRRIAFPYLTVGAGVRQRHLIYHHRKTSTVALLHERGKKRPRRCQPKKRARRAGSQKGVRRHLETPSDQSSLLLR